MSKLYALPIKREVIHIKDQNKWEKDTGFHKAVPSKGFSNQPDSIAPFTDPPVEYRTP